MKASDARRGARCSSSLSRDAKLFFLCRASALFRASGRRGAEPGMAASMQAPSLAESSSPGASFRRASRARPSDSPGTSFRRSSHSSSTNNVFSGGIVVGCSKGNSWNMPSFVSRRKSCWGLPGSDLSNHARHGRKAANEAAKIVRDLGETVTTVAISSDQKLFAAGAMNKKAVVCDIAKGDVVADITAGGQITASAFGLAGRQARLILGTFTGLIIVYRVHSQSEELSEKFGNGEMVTCMSIDDASTRLAVGGKSTNILLYATSFGEDSTSISVLYTIDTEAGSTGILSLSIDAKCTKLVAGGESKIFSLWNIPATRSATRRTTSPSGSKWSGSSTWSGSPTSSASQDDSGHKERRTSLKSVLEMAQQRGIIPSTPNCDSIMRGSGVGGKRGKRLHDELQK